MGEGKLRSWLSRKEKKEPHTDNPESPTSSPRFVQSESSKTESQDGEEWEEEKQKSGSGKKGKLDNAAKVRASTGRSVDDESRLNPSGATEGHANVVAEAALQQYLNEGTSLEQAAAAIAGTAPGSSRLDELVPLDLPRANTDEQLISNHREDDKELEDSKNSTDKTPRASSAIGDDVITPRTRSRMVGWLWRRKDKEKDRDRGGSQGDTCPGRSTAPGKSRTSAFSLRASSFKDAANVGGFSEMAFRRFGRSMTKNAIVKGDACSWKSFRVSRQLGTDDDDVDMVKEFLAHREAWSSLEASPSNRFYVFEYMQSVSTNHPDILQVSKC